MKRDRPGASGSTIEEGTLRRYPRLVCPGNRVRYTRQNEVCSRLPCIAAVMVRAVDDDLPAAQGSRCRGLLPGLLRRLQRYVVQQLLGEALGKILSSSAGVSHRAG